MMGILCRHWKRLSEKSQCRNADRGADEQRVGKGVWRYVGWEDETSQKGICCGTKR